MTDVFRTLSFNIGNITLEGNNSLFCGNIDTKIYNHIKNQIDKQDVYLYDFTNRNKSFPVSTFELSDKLTELYNHIDTISKKYSNDYFNRHRFPFEHYKIKIRPIVIFIDDIVTHFNSDDYRSIDYIVKSLKAIMTISHKANVYIMIFTKKDHIRNDIDELFNNIIDFSNNTITHIIKEDEITNNIKDNEDEDEEDNFVPIFSFKQTNIAYNE